MNLFFGILFLFVLFFYFYFRLPEGNPIREWIDKNAINIGHGFIVLWIVFLFTKDPKLGIFYGTPLVLIAFYFARKKKNGDGDE